MGFIGENKITDYNNGTRSNKTQSKVARSNIY